jgi:hypothetical protein
MSMPREDLRAAYKHNIGDTVTHLHDGRVGKIVERGPGRGRPNYYVLIETDGKKTNELWNETAIDERK